MRWLLASFDESFLEMPSVILKKVMRSKQRYFTLLDAHTGAMRPNFITIRNGPAHNSSKVIIGNENVVYARFADAAYFYRYDIERPLESLLPKLDTLTFQAKLGSMLDKTRRIESLIGPIGAQLNAHNTEIETASQTAHLCKADLVTKMVVEMTSLQGVMGRIYHLRQGGAPAVADAIFEHYLPRFAGDDSPKSTPGLIVALADKLDSIAGLFAVGLEPKGNADPFALRRAAIGVVQGLVDNAAATFSLRQALTAVRSSLPAPMSDDAFEAALRFIIGRQRAALLEAGHRHDVVEAVVNVKGEIPYEAQRFVEQLGQIVKRDDWPALLAAYSRCARIIKSSGVLAEDISAVDINDVEPATHRLSEKLSSLTRPGDINELAAILASIEPLITEFFNKVLVNAEDPVLRRMRLSLVSRVVDLANGIVDFSKVEGF